jgi:hypothetical protein
MAFQQYEHVSLAVAGIETAQESDQLLRGGRWPLAQRAPSLLTGLRCRRELD